MVIVRDDILGAYLWRILRYFSQLEKKTNFSLVSLPVVYADYMHVLSAQTPTTILKFGNPELFNPTQKITRGLGSLIFY